MNTSTFTIEQLSALTWQQLLALQKPTILAILDELSLDYCEDDNYFRIASTLYRWLKQQPALETVEDEILVAVEFHNLSFRELHRKPIPVPPKQPEPKPSKYRVLKTHYNKTGYYYGMRVKRLLVKDLSTNETFWTGSSALDNIQVGDIVTDSTGVGFVVPVNRTAKA